VSQVANPAIDKLVSSVSEELVFAQVWIKRVPSGFELRHVNDRSAESERLRTVRLAEVRTLAQKTAIGAFRPLRSAPNLQSGWRLTLSNATELDVALRELYPGAVADWFAAQAELPPTTDYRTFTERQTGMYRITTKLTNAEAAQIIRACCPAQFCLKRRLWSVRGLAIDASETKSIIPCLEPCAVLLEFARTAVRIYQAGKVQISVDDLPIVAAAINAAMNLPDPTSREADFSSPRNPRRAQLLLEKISDSHEAGSVTE
jgi:hypothetical protein